MWRKLLLGLGLIILIAGAIFYWLNRPKPILTVLTWSGEYGRAQASALFQPYGEKTRSDVRIVQYDGDLKDLNRGDVVDFEEPAAIAACNQGLLEDIKPDGDFVSGATGKCWIGSVIYSRVIAHAPNINPKKAQDFFDLKNFPGPRGLRKTSAKYNVELALLADGVAPGDVYSTLEKDFSRVLKKYQTIKQSIVWWTNSSEPLELLKDGKVIMTIMSNDQLFEAKKRNQSLGVIWDRELYEVEAFGIPKSTQKLEMAKDFVTFATSPEGMTGVASWVPYGPARKSATGPTINPELKIDMTAFSPTAADHFATAFKVDDAWWAAHGAEAEARWQAFVNQ